MKARKVWKYPFHPDLEPQTREMPEGAKFLTAQAQGSAIMAWFEVDQDMPRCERTFQTLWTGNSIVPEGAVYLATVQLPPLVWHLYELAEGGASCA